MWKVKYSVAEKKCEAVQREIIKYLYLRDNYNIHSNL